MSISLFFSVYLSLFGGSALVFGIEIGKACLSAVIDSDKWLYLYSFSAF
jgi:hypothetical protein